MPLNTAMPIDLRAEAPAPDLQASGRTAHQLEHDLTKTLGSKYLQNPQIGVSVKEYHSQRFTMDGAFKRSGVFPLEGGLTLLQATANAGGFDMNADETIILFHFQQP